MSEENFQNVHLQLRALTMCCEQLCQAVDKALMMIEQLQEAQQSTGNEIALLRDAVDLLRNSTRPHNNKSQQ